MEINRCLNACFLTWVLLLGSACTAEVDLFFSPAVGTCPADSPGDCEEASACRVGDACEEDYVCRGAEDAQPGSPGTCQPECRVGSNQGCPQGHVCMGPEGAKYQAPGRCHAPCTVGDNQGCPQGHVCVGPEGAAKGAFGVCQKPPECHVGDDSCEAGYLCTGIDGNNQNGAPGTCLDVAPCRVGDNQCPAWQNCVGDDDNLNGSPGTCQGEPECRVGDNRCPAWQNCTGYESQAPNAPGYCQGEPECFVGDNRCAGNTYCTGYESNNNGSPGRCLHEPECRVGSPWTCPADTTCVGAPNAPWNSPGSCTPSPRPRNINQLYVFFGHNSVGNDLTNALSRTHPNLRILRPTPASVDSSGANLFGNPNRQPAFLSITTYDLYRNYSQAIQELNSFTQQVRTLMAGQRLDIAFVKFCFIAFDDNAINEAQVESLFDAYAQQMDALQMEFPELILVHFTQATRPCAPTQTYLHAGNLRRARFSQRIRERYGHTGRVFDLARLEATNAQGHVTYCSYGNQLLGLLTEYASGTDGHFNATGGNMIARELASLLSSVR